MITLLLKTKNSSGYQNITFDKQPDGSMSMTIFGEYEGSRMQLDFELNKADQKELIYIFEQAYSDGK